MSTQLKIKASDDRTVEQITEHYHIEKQLADQLRHSNKSERLEGSLYTKLYDALFSKVTHHSHHSRPTDASANTLIQQRIDFLQHFMANDAIFLEIGPGNCHLCREIAPHVQQVYAVDVATEITKDLALPKNVDLIISDGCSIPTEPSSIDLAYSHQLMEHLHPEDAYDQLKNICTALKTGGTYVCVTPHRLSGPHDISKYFDEVATGFHLKEYSIVELAQLFKRAGFSKIRIYKVFKNRVLSLPVMFPISLVILALEKGVGLLPFPLRRTCAEKSLIFRTITIAGVK